MSGRRVVVKDASNGSQQVIILFWFFFLFCFIYLKKKREKKLILASIIVVCRKWNIKPVPQRPDVLLVRSWSTRSCRATTTTSTCRRTATYGGRTRNSPHELSHIKKYVHVESNWLLLSNYIDHMKYTNREFDYFSLARFRWSSFQFAVQLWFASI